MDGRDENISRWNGSRWRSGTENQLEEGIKSGAKNYESSQKLLQKEPF